MQTTSNRRKRKKERLHTYENKVGVWLTVCLECSGKTSFSLKRQIDIDIFRLAVTARATAATNAKWKITTRKIEKWKYGFLSFCWSVSQDSSGKVLPLWPFHIIHVIATTGKGAVLKMRKLELEPINFQPSFATDLAFWLTASLSAAAAAARLWQTPKQKTSYKI